MPSSTRRDFLQRAGAALALGGAASLVLAGDPEPTAPSGTLGSYQDFLAVENGRFDPADKNWAPTEDNILGPYFRRGAPYRAKITPPLEPGETLLIRGRVWGLDTRRPLAGAIVDIWQANASGRYDNDDPQHPPAANFFANRARLLSDEQGNYEYETVKPGRYQVGEGMWRPAHIHYLVRAAGYAQLVTQLYFKGDPYNDKDQFIKKSLIIDPEKVTTPNGAYWRGTFDIVLSPQQRA